MPPHTIGVRRTALKEIKTGLAAAVVFRALLALLVLAVACS
jgi:hypothetical protein